MTRKTHQWQRWTKLPLAVAVAAGMSGQAAAYSFYLGDVEAQFNTTLSAGVGWRVEDRDSRLIAQGNLGPEFANTTVGASTNNYDDGNLNFDQWDTYSKIVKGNSELYLNQYVDNTYLTRVGALVRGRYWYDFELKDESRPHVELNEEASDNASGGELLDAYVFSDWYFGNVPVSLRYGKQVVSWGESTFIQGGINVINPVDVPAFRAPGSQLKDALLPVEMFYMSAGVTENITLETFVQTDWEPIRPDDCGTFFSTNDFAADGCGPVLLAGQLPDDEAYPGYVAPRLGDKEADAKDQFGVAMRWYVPALNDSELGFYYIKYNSRLPYVSGTVRDDRVGERFPSYYIEYPENIDLYGVSINTTTPGGWSLGAEYSFREGVPLQWNAFELIYGGLQQENEETGDPASLLQQQREAENPGVDLRGSEVNGYDRFNVSQAQFTLIKFFDQVMGASRLSFITEFGATYIHDFPDTDEARYGRSGTFGIGELPGGACAGTGATGQKLNLNASYCTNEGFTTDFSWGYRARLVWDYLNALAGVNLSPQLAWSHDVEGYSPQPGGAFNEGSKAIGLSLQAVYQNKITGEIGYTNFFGGKPYNELTDRDFVSASVSYSF
jgi:hypothetical protein